MSKPKRKKSTTSGDPHAAREAQKYDNPIPSREYVLDVLEKSGGPLQHRQLCDILSLSSDEHIEALRRRLIAMVRDGQLMSNRKGAFGRTDKMDLVKGRVIANKEGYGFLRPSGGGEDIYLSNRQMRKVFDGDEALVRCGPANYKGQMEGAIVEVIKRNTTHVVGQFFCEHGNCYLKPDNPKIQHNIFIDTKSTMNARNGQIVAVEILQQPDRKNYPQGRVNEILGSHMAPGMEIDVAIRSHGIPHEWSQPVLDEAKQFGSEVSERDKKHRVDLRELPFVTIDGEDARDFDDAVYCEKKRTGGWRLFVAIADVSNYVSPGGALDVEAQNRGNSVYFPNHVVPMLPEALSNGLCSLNPKVDRLCMVSEMTISAAGKISGYQFYEAVIHSQARMTYTKVGQIIAERKDKKSAIRKTYASLLVHLDELYALYSCLQKARGQRGAIEFETTETRMQFDENRKIKQIIPVYRNDAHRLIEECMLAANVCAARFLEAHDIPALYRVHEEPKAEKFELLQKFLSELGLHMPRRKKTLPADYQKVLAHVKDRPDAHLIQTVLLRSMNQAVYQSENLGHFGLAYTAYAHFTSPIRRYPDLLIHRAIRSVIRSRRDSNKVKRVKGAKVIAKKNIYPYSEANIAALGEQCSLSERRADDATRDVVSWLKCEFLQEHVGECFDGVVSSVTGFGLFVELSDLFIEGLIHITSLPHDYYHFSASHHSLTGERSGRSFGLGDTVTVRVIRVSLEERKIDFELIDSGKHKTKSKAKAKTKVKAKVKAKKSALKKEVQPKSKKKDLSTPGKKKPRQARKRKVASKGGVATTNKPKKK